MKKKIFPFILASMMLIPGTSVFAENTAAEESLQKDEITFTGYEWGESYETIFNAEITSDMVEGKDYYVTQPEEKKDYKMLEINNQTVGGYDTEKIFALYKDKLIIGVYEDCWKPILQGNLYDKYCVVYGQPVSISDEGTDDASYLWMDADSNWIVMNGEDGFICYCDGSLEKEILTGFVGDDLEDKFGFDIYSIISENTNTDNYEGI